MNAKAVVIGALLSAVLLLTSCAPKSDGPGGPWETDVVQDDDVYDFCKKISTCSEARIDIKDSTTDDTYALSVVGKQGTSCALGLLLDRTATERLKPLEGLGVVCLQEWNAAFEKIAGFDAETCEKYVDSLMMNIVFYAADAETAVCTGAMKDELVKTR